MTTPKQPDRETKSFTVSVKDAEKGTVEAVFSTFGVKDHDDDLTLPGAFDDNAKVAISAYGHMSWMGEMPVGRGALRVEKDRAVLDGKFFMTTQRGKETFEVVKEMGEMQEWSYGFDILETGEITEEMRQKGIRRVIKRAKVYEVSPVLRGAGIGTRTLAVKEEDASRVPIQTVKYTGHVPAEPIELTPEEIDAKRTVDIAARREFRKFIQTQARLAS